LLVDCGAVVGSLGLTQCFPLGQRQTPSASIRYRRAGWVVGGRHSLCLIGDPLAPPQVTASEGGKAVRGIVGGDGTGATGVPLCMRAGAGALLGSRLEGTASGGGEKNINTVKHPPSPGFLKSRPKY